ncbi:zinc-dependent alcohol dehydrogenase [Kocuria tytonis]|uniref:Glutathione-dependent formaldehyde dehydrogenase n=1 Tax=Kocuria tytonis TaxID=2054280 RepID=A0A495A8B4_9MICC|nr:zinc-dependent alcohol dehydrogenase [Kocuria tytonis]RKQ36256.1 glutathione-dependent formaldehyde dehydrogenase [Kocuria tytonis]
MRALTWQGLGDVRVENVPDPVLQDPTDAIVRVTSTAICGSDLHLYGVLGPYLHKDYVLGHEFMGIVEEVGSGVSNLQPGDRVVVPFVIACGHCWMCDRGLYAACETTQIREMGSGAALFGFSSLYGSVPGGQAEMVRVPHADFGPVKLPQNFEDERFLYLSDILPTAWQGVKYANVGEEDTLAVLGLGPVGQLAVRSAKLQGVKRIIAVDLVEERLALAKSWGVETVDLREVDDVSQTLREMTDGRGPDGVLDAVGMEAHGNPIAEKIVAGAARLPKPLGRKAIETVGIDRLDALHTAIHSVRRAGTVSLSGVYGGMADPMPMMEMFDKGISMRMGQCHVRHWTDELLEVLSRPEDVLGLESLATHHVSLEDAPEAYKMFQEKKDGCIKVVLKP